MSQDIDAMIATLQAMKAAGQTPAPAAAPAPQPAPAAPQPAAPAIDYTAIGEAVAKAMTSIKPAASVMPVQPPPSGPPASDKGPAIQPYRADWKRELAEHHGLSMTDAAKTQMAADLGVAEARKMRLKYAQESGATERIKVTTKP